MSTKLINNSQVKSALRVKGFWGSIIAGAAIRITGFNRINRIYSHISDYNGIEFADRLISYLNIKINYNPEDLEYIPKTGPFIIVSNHPFGAIDGIIMLSLIGKVRPDIKILTNFLLSYIPNLENEFFPVNPFTQKPGLRSSLSGLKMALEHLQNGGVLGLFPSGEVSSNCNRERVVKDIAWQKSIIKLIQNVEVPVVPLFFSGQNSALFHFLGKIHPLLRTVRLPHELSNKKNKTVILKIGAPVTVSSIKEYASIEELSDYLYNRTYALEGDIDYEKLPQKPSVRNFIKTGQTQLANIRHQSKEREEVGATVEKALLEREIGSIASKRLFTVNGYSCYLADYDDIPNIMKEIAIRREIAFRSVGEGTGKGSDSDTYDTYYKHLILWDSTTCSIVGAYRLGIGNEILKKYGIKGFYSNTLFRYSHQFKYQLEHSIELGRSFVSMEYQKDPLALMLLIKGLFYTVIEYKDVKYLLGPVSISSSYPMFYRSLIVHYLKERHSAGQYSHLVSPRKPFKPDFGKVNPQGLLQHKLSSIEKFDRFMLKLSDGSYRLPTLLKKYLKINARIIDYNVDPDFNYCVDGLIMLSLNEVPRSEADALSKEFKDKEAIYSRFGITPQQPAL